MRRKSDLPVKDCATCGRPMVWRRRWAKVWDEVRHCSDRCRADARRGGGGRPTLPPVAASQPDR